MARTKTNSRNDTNTLTTSWGNRHLDKLYFCVFRIFIFFFIDYFLNEFSKKYWVTALVRSMTFIGSLKLHSVTYIGKKSVISILYTTGHQEYYDLFCLVSSKCLNLYYVFGNYVLNHALGLMSCYILFYFTNLQERVRKTCLLLEINAIYWQPTNA